MHAVSGGGELSWSRERGEQRGRRQGAGEAHGERREGWGRRMRRRGEAGAHWDAERWELQESDRTGGQVVRVGKIVVITVVSLS